MDIVRLIIALGLPWIGGFYSLRLLESRLGTEQHVTLQRQLGYGFFLGYAGLYGIILATNTILGKATFLPVIAACLILTTVAFIAWRRQGPAPAARPATSGVSLKAKVLFWFLLLATALHLSIAVFEVLNRPVYPWDAWLAWIYRSKAWFFSGEIYTLASSAEWLNAGTSAPYTIDARDYPTFASVIPFWAATSAGVWNESLVNTPVILCGFALALGIYGQCREHGLSQVFAMAAVYLALSLPLMGNHLALAGYADIWLAGFAGLGFIALIRGYADSNKLQTLLGLGMIALGMSVKNEGTVWLYAGIAFLALTTMPFRLTLLATASLIILALIAWATGVTYLELPLLGGVGIRDNVLFVPFAGSHQLHFYDVGAVYFRALLVHGSWHLLWPMMFALILGLCFAREPRGRKAIASFLFLFVMSQLVIFGLTEQGRWAQHYTAVNRLPLQFVPALVFCLVSGVAMLVSPSGSRPASRTWIFIPGLLSAVLLLVGVLTLLNSQYPATNGTEREFTASNLKVVVGRGQHRDERIEIEAYSNGTAIASSGPVALDAAELPILQYTLESEGWKQPIFFWRIVSEPDNVHFITLNGRGSGHISLTDNNNWRGLITEVGVGVYGEPRDEASIKSITLLPRDLSTTLATLWSSWTGVEPHSQKSVNFVPAGSDQAALPAPLLGGILLGLAILAYLVVMVAQRRTSPYIAAICALALTIWVLLDVKWLHNQVLQAAATWAIAEQRGTLNYIDRQKDRKIEDLVIASKKVITPEAVARILIISGEQEDKYSTLRAKYHLLPHAGIVQSGDVIPGMNPYPEYALVVNIRSQDRDEAARKSLVGIQNAAGAAELDYKRVLSHEIGTLYQLKPIQTEH